MQLRKLKIQRTQARTLSQENLVKLTMESNATLKALKKTVEKVKDRERVVRTKPRNLVGGRPDSGRHGAGPPASPSQSEHLYYLFYAILSFK